MKDLWFIFVFVITSCSFNQPVSVSDTINQNIVDVCIERSYDIINEQTIQDAVLFSQDPLYYADSDSLLLSAEELYQFHNSFKTKFFKVWNENLGINSSKIIEMKEYYQKLLSDIYTNPGIGENKIKRDSLFALNLIKTANLNGNFNTMKKGMITTYTNIRVLPSEKPFFLSFLLAGEGYPFDYWQNSTIPIGTPIFILHETENWALIESHICSGWILRNHFAYISDKDIEQIISSDQIVITKDKIPLFSTENDYVGHADIGTVFSIQKEFENYYKVIYFNRNNNNMLPLIVSKELSQKIPIPLTTKNIALICSEMMNQVYGWGGMYFNRDCSQSLLDLYIGFGILLPRNGKQQAYNFGRFHSMSELENISQKKKEIIDNATPFLTLVRTPGHIMLYIGSEGGEPLVFHTVWGIRTIEQDNVEGRFILGKTMITTLEPGKELHNVDPKMSLINRLEGITFFK